MAYVLSINPEVHERRILVLCMQLLGNQCNFLIGRHPDSDNPSCVAARQNVGRTNAETEPSGDMRILQDWLEALAASQTRKNVEICDVARPLCASIEHPCDASGLSPRRDRRVHHDQQVFLCLGENATQCAVFVTSVSRSLGFVCSKPLCGPRSA